MRLHAIKSAPKNDLVYRLYDFQAVTDFALSMVAETETIKDGWASELPQVYAQGETVKKYVLDGRVFYYGTDKNLWEKVGNKMVKIILKPFDNPPTLFSCLYRGNKTYFASSDGYAYSFGKYYDTLKLPEGKYFTSYKNGLYFALGHTLFFCPDFFSVNLKKSYLCLTADEDEGDIKGISKLPDGLYVFFERAVYKLFLPFYPEKTEFIKILSLKSVVENSVFTCKNNAYFISENAVFSFDGNEIKPIKKFDGYTVTETFSVGEDYFIRLEKNGVKICYAILSDGTEYFISGYLLLGVGKIYNSNKREWKSVKLDFGIKGEKTLKGVNIETNKEVKVTVYFDENEKEFLVKNGNIKTGLKGEKFAIKLTPKENGTVIRKIEFLYAK